MTEKIDEVFTDGQIDIRVAMPNPPWLWVERVPCHDGLVLCTLDWSQCHTGRGGFPLNEFRHAAIEELGDYPVVGIVADWLAERGLIP